MTPTPRAPGPALRTILLDIDGTLIDSNDAHARAWVDALRTHGYVVPFEEVRPLIGKGGDKLVPELTGLDPDSGEAKRLSETRSKLFLERELPTLRPTKGARALLERLTSTGMELEWVFFSVTPKPGKRSMMALALTSSSRASSLIRT